MKEDIRRLRREILWYRVGAPVNEIMSYVVTFGAGFQTAKLIEDLSQGNIKSAVYRGIVSGIGLSAAYVFNRASRQERRLLRVRREELSDLEG